jgi:hypothetical protein
MKKYYLEVIGGSNPNQLYVVNANYLHIGQRYYKFEAEDNVLLAVYPIERTIIKSIETSKKD